MEKFEKNFCSICDHTASELKLYYSELSQSNVNDKKQITANHYGFLGKLLNVIKSIDALTSEISAAMLDADRRNDIQHTQKLSTLFDICIEHRKNLEDYFTASEAAIKQENPSVLSTLKNHTDILIRKTINLKDIFHV